MDILGITIWREARSEGPEGMAGVANVILNRANSLGRGWPPDAEKVCLQSYQFSCWNSSDPQRNLYPAELDPQYIEALNITTNPIGDCNCYYDTSIMPPKAALGKPIISIGRLRFYKI